MVNIFLYTKRKKKNEHDKSCCRGKKGCCNIKGILNRYLKIVNLIRLETVYGDQREECSFENVVKSSVIFSLPSSVYQWLMNYFNYRVHNEKVTVYKHYKDLPWSTDSELSYISSSTRDVIFNSVTWEELIRTYKYSPLEMPLDQFKVAFESLSKLPTRCWISEWKQLHTMILNEEYTLFDLMNGNVSRLTENDVKEDNPNMKLECLKNLFCSYGRLEKLQIEYLWLCQMVLRAFSEPILRYYFAEMLICLYNQRWKKKNKLNYSLTNCGSLSKSYDVCASYSYSRNFSQRKSSCAFYTDVFALISHEIANYTLAEDTACATSLDCKKLLDWGYAGFEFMGVWFQLVDDYDHWKVIDQEIQCCRSIYFDSKYPCSPFIVSLSNLQYNLSASALLVSSILNPSVPIQFTPSYIRKVSPTSSSVNDIVQLQNYSDSTLQPHTHLPNPFYWVSAYSPCLLPSTGVYHLNKIQILSSVYYQIFIYIKNHVRVNSSSTDLSWIASLEAIKKNLADKEDYTSLDEITRHFKDIFFHNWISYINASILESLDFKTKKKSSFDHFLTSKKSFHSSYLYAIAFSHSTNSTHFKEISLNFHHTEVINFAVSVFKCSPLRLFNFETIKEDNPIDVISNTSREIKFLGYSCYVWYVNPETKTSDILNTGYKKKKKSETNKTIQLKLPWRSNEFIMILTPTSYTLKSNAYLNNTSPFKSHDNVKNEYNSHAGNLLQLIVITCSNISSLFRIMHSLGLPISIGIWHFWLLACHINHQYLKRVLSCCIVAYAVRRIYKYFDWYQRYCWNRYIIILLTGKVIGVLMQNKN